MAKDIYEVDSLALEATCMGITLRQWDKYMQNAVKANGSKIRRLIKKHLPDLYFRLELKYFNPYECKSKRTTTHFIYVHSGIEYFIRKL